MDSQSTYRYVELSDLVTREDVIRRRPALDALLIAEEVEA
jgi:hypothetical protein